ncbi:MAG TPA: PilZ domain-containing protein [Kofleriaceae bacterium]
MVDSRKTLRYSIDLPARLVLGGALLSARIRNLSLGGVFLVGPALPIGTRCRLRFKAPHVELDSWCITRWTTAEGCGLQFEPLQAIDVYQLARFIKSASRPTSRIPTDAILRPVR